jgi:flagellar L-ring protein precursor FlgH
MFNIRITKSPILIVLVIMVIMLANLSIGAAASLWSDTAQGAELFSDRKAHAVGDILTILINESSSASRVGASNNSKSTDISMNAGTGIFHGIASASAGNSDTFKSSGSITNSNAVTGRLTVQVIDVKPNGNLVISGTQTIKQNNEEQKITVSGEIRPEDITVDNTVLSTYVANAQIKIDGKGPLSSKQRQGILSQIFNFLF